MKRMDFPLQLDARSAVVDVEAAVAEEAGQRHVEFLCEFDGGREREVIMQTLRAAD